jgi:hypothetical protein
MSTARVRFTLLAASMLFSLFALSSCGTTSVRSSWKDDTYQTQPKKFLIVGVAKNESVRRYYEQEFVNSLAKSGVQAVPSHSHFQTPIDSVVAMAKVQELGIDAILVTRLIDQKEVQTYYPPTTTYMGPAYPGYYGGWYGYYGYGMDVVSTPGYVEIENVYSLETNVFDIATHKLIFSALSDTKVQSVDDSTVKEVIDVVSNAMREKGLIP